ncbi:hypothetical protein RHMOL_Rhmol02G0196000 [Rhododendron molle]|uniref:Uncharacterized protein n=1 Tax=Rhododendron molle TaxID=49168 RepID=A0ACC0PTD1_RHOML|nr:hypothetical protein RHMOL_Rhmol02G0196000 [Rhododendron molle]
MAEHGNGGSEGEVVDQPEDAGGPMEVEKGDQQPLEAVMGQGVVVASHGGGNQGRKQEVCGEDVWHMSKREQCATEEPRAVGPSVEPMGSSAAVGGPSIIGRGTGGADGSGAGGDDTGSSESSPRDSAKGKGVVTKEEETTEAPFVYQGEDVLFLPAATLLSHRPVTKHYVAEYLNDEALAKLLEENPAIGIAVLKAKQERARAIVASEMVERAEMERKEMEEPLKDMEAEDRASAEAVVSRVTVVMEAESLICLDISAEAYVPPTPHLSCRRALRLTRHGGQSTMPSSC